MTHEIAQSAIFTSEALYSLRGQKGADVVINFVKDDGDVDVMVQEINHYGQQRLVIELTFLRKTRWSPCLKK